MADIKVRKKDGSLEDWSRYKLLTSISKAGVPSEKAEAITSDVEKWAQASAEDAIVDSSKIRGKIIEILREADSAAAENFETYKKG